MIAGAFPGLIFTPDYKYQPRWPWGQDGSLRVISCVAVESIPPGVLVQAVPGQVGDSLLVRIARDATQLVGVTCYDPDKYDHAVIYEDYDTLPVVRRGSVFCAFTTILPPFMPPAPCAAARAYVGPAMGQFTTDPAGGSVVAFRGITFSIASADYYVNTDGSPQADVPEPVPPIPLGVTDTTFGSGCALVDLSLP